MNTYTEKSVLGFKLLSLIKGIVDQSKASGFAATKVGPESKCKDDICGDFVSLGKLFSDFSLGESCSAWVQYINDLKIVRLD